MMAAQPILIDTHAHIYEDRIIAEIGTYISRASENKVGMIMMPNIDLSSIDKMLFIEDQYPTMKSMMGLHPCHVFDDFKTVLSEMEKWFGKRNFVGVGETGIDLYWDKSFVEQQMAAFDIQIAWARSQRLPVIIHSRESIDMCIEMVSERQDGSLTGVFHCFTGDEIQAKQIKDLGFYIGIGGVVTYKNSELPKVLIDNGLSNVVLETDSPYLPPVPHRGKLNEPAFIPYVVEKLGEVFQLEKEQIEALTTKNASQLFNL